MPGTTVAGVDVGGLSRTGARDRIIHDLGDRLSAPVTVRVHGETTADVVPSALGIRLDADCDGRRAPTAPAGSRRACCRTSTPGASSRCSLYPKSLKLPKELADARAAAAQRQAGRPGRRHRRRGPGAGRAASTTTPRRCARSPPPHSSRDGAVTLTPAITKPPVPTTAAQAAAADAKLLLARSRSRSRTSGEADRADDAAGARAAAEGAARSGTELRARASRRSGCATCWPRTRRTSRGRPVDAHWQTDGSRARLVKHQNGRGIDGEKTGDAMLAAVLTSTAPAARPSSLGPIAPALTTERGPRARHPPSGSRPSRPTSAPRRRTACSTSS